MKLHAIRRSPHTVGFYGHNWHVVLFGPRRPYGNSSAWGVHLRHRISTDPERWRQTLVRGFAKAEPIPGGGGCWTWEVSRWNARRATSTNGGNRLTIKKFVRLKVGLGGEAA